MSYRFQLTTATVILLTATSLQSLGQVASTPIKIGGQDVIKLERTASDQQNHPEFLSITVLQGRGMNLLQISAFVPGRGETNIFYSPPIEEAAKLLSNEGDDEFGNENFKIGGAFLVPYANRIRGKLSADGKTITSQWENKTLILPANWGGSNPGAEQHSIHGLINKRQVDQLKRQIRGDIQVVTGVIHAGDFGGRWPSKTDLEIRITLSKDYVSASITAKNVGTEDEPIGIGWHPYFNIPSGYRKQAQLYLPAVKVAEINNYDEDFPTGKLIDVTNTKWDFNKDGGKPLGDIYLDDNFNQLTRKNGNVIAEITDPAAHYGIRITSSSKEVNTIQVYAPLNKPFLAVEEQFNVNDPFGKEWKGHDNGMITLKPGQSVTWKDQLELFVPQLER